ncbi:MAG TPA: tRNA 2-thiouridine(34) synthase MnmA [Nitrospiraceae bacterium]|nr:tRNA 2-thiouridine(34) synthase MnmA [Nitrospiraceae bacterium]
MNKVKVLVGMSGGVDSCVAASLLVRKGFDVHGITLQVWEHEDESVAASKRWQERGCCKVGIARYVAQKLGISHEVVDTRETFRRNVIDDFLGGYLGGTTPNPCVRCNERVKIRTLYEVAQARGMDYVATGHYARVVKEGEAWHLYRSADLRKDQSYFLYRIDKAWLPRILFPVGAMQKRDVWREAEDLGLPVDELKESQEICFVSHGDYRTFLEQEVPEAKRTGDFVDMEGRVLGRHDGIAFYTPGQRRGLGIAAGRRLYVQKVVPETSTVVLCPDEGLLESDCAAGELNILDPESLWSSREIAVKVRYATPAVSARVLAQDERTVHVRFHQPQRALSPGQSVVFYAGDRVVGGGIISRR